MNVAKKATSANRAKSIATKLDAVMRLTEKLTKNLNAALQRQAKKLRKRRSRSKVQVSTNLVDGRSD